VLEALIGKMNRKRSSDNREITSHLEAKGCKLSQLSDYRKHYTADKFIADLDKYFDGEVDFNLEKIRCKIEEPGELGRLVMKAEGKNTHPVTEFTQEIFKEMAA